MPIDVSRSKFQGSSQLIEWGNACLHQIYNIFIYTRNLQLDAQKDRTKRKEKISYSRRTDSYPLNQETNKSIPFQRKSSIYVGNFLLEATNNFYLTFYFYVIMNLFGKGKQNKKTW